MPSMKNLKLRNFRTEPVADRPGAWKVFATVEGAAPPQGDGELFMGTALEGTEGWGLEPNNSDPDLVLRGLEDFHIQASNIDEFVAKLAISVTGAQFNISEKSGALNDAQMGRAIDMQIHAMGLIACETDTETGFVAGVGSALTEFIVNAFDESEHEAMIEFSIKAIRNTVERLKARKEAASKAKEGLLEILEGDLGQVLGEILKKANRKPDDDAAPAKPH